MERLQVNYLYHTEFCVYKPDECSSTVINTCEQICEGPHGEHGSVRSHRDSQQRPAQVPYEGSHDQTGLPPSLLLHLPVQVKNNLSILLHIAAAYTVT